MRASAYRTMSSVVSMVSVLAIAATLPPVPLFAQNGGPCIPVRERPGRKFGCFITARTDLGHLSKRQRLYWHLDTFATSSAADSAMEPRSTVVESLGRVWLFTIGAADWRPVGGHREARIGPLPLIGADRYAAVYMEGIFQPGMHTVVHRHPGAEAWYTLDGSMCLETPNGTVRQRAGDPGKMVRGGLPMMLTGTGTAVRRSLVLILKDASKPSTMLATDWKPKGLCTK